MNNKELDNLVESFLSPKQIQKAMDLNELFALFESMEKSKELLQEQSSGERPMPITQRELSSATDLPIEYFVKKLARQSPQQLDTPEAQQIFYSTLQKTISTKNNLLSNLHTFINKINSIKSKESISFGESLAHMMFVSSIFSMIKNYSATTSGTFFETFIEFLGGKRTQISQFQYSIYDLVDNEDIYWSLKLSAPNTAVNGSLENMLAFFDYPGVTSNAQDGKSDKLWFLIVNKTSETQLDFKICFITLEQFLELPSKHNASIPIGAPQGQLELWKEYKNEKTTDDKLTVLRNYNIRSEESLTKFNFTKDQLLAIANVPEASQKGLTISLSTDELIEICSAEAHELETFRKKMKELLVDVDDIYFKAKTFMITNDPVHGQDASQTAGRIEQTLVEMTQEILEQQKP